jgi:hypothetical protein
MADKSRGGDVTPRLPDDVRSRDAVETAIDRSKEPTRTWESVIQPHKKDEGWSSSAATQGAKTRRR